ncbi:MAG: ABC transporter substrate-binding protein [Actinobacteria bacterium]|nr:ABC transporter substrate-binding protein [Actinomycetota bacterium]
MAVQISDTASAPDILADRRTPERAYRSKQSGNGNKTREERNVEMRASLRTLFIVAMFICAAVLLAACGGSGSSGGSSAEDETTEAQGGEETTASSTSVLGTSDPAKGKPIVFGMLNLENGPVTFPQIREGAEAAADYINEYKGGIQGRPIEIDDCPTDGQPSTSTNCANQIVEKNPLLILGGGDTGSTGSLPVYERAGLAYIGGAPLAPAETNAKNGAIFISLSIGGNAAAAAYAHDELGAETGAVMQVADTPGKFSGNIIKETMEGAGMEVHMVSVPPTASDLSSAAAEAVSSSPDVIYINIPQNCAAVLKALESVGNTATLVGLSLCASPESIKAAGASAEGLYYSEPFESLESGSEEAQITMTALDEFKPSASPDALAVAGFGSVMNIWEKMSEAPAADLEDPSKILALFKEGKENPNWMAHPYTCNGKAVLQAAVCNGAQKMGQVKNGKGVIITNGWVNGEKYLRP